MAITGGILKREWVPLVSPESLVGHRTVKIMTWNMLAQTLVRRELFPNSDCLKAAQREKMLTAEILTYNPDIACLQEVDRLEKQLPPLQAAGYAHTYASGPGKLHGCMIIYKQDLFEKVAEDVIYYDDVDLNQHLPSTSTQPRLATTRTTKNIGLIVALTRKDDPTKGCIVATTHMFWHPKFKYERARQAGLLVRSVRKMQEHEPRFATWPAYLAGDFNTEPEEAVYALLRGAPLDSSHERSLNDSRVIHVSRDPTVAVSPTAPREDEASAAVAADPNADHPDRVIKDSRPAIESDMLLSDDELRLLYSGVGPGLRSGYDEALTEVPDQHPHTYGARDPKVQLGKYEPGYTSFTFFWKLSLDYIFIAQALEESGSKPPRIVGVLKCHRKDDMEPGLPRQGICGSDHTSLMLEIAGGG